MPIPISHLTGDDPSYIYMNGKFNDRRFMWTLYMSNAEHWVPISTVASFKRMREFTSLGVEWVARAVKLVSEELEVDETNTKVRRTTEVKEPKGQFERSVYAVSLFFFFQSVFFWYGDLF